MHVVCLLEEKLNEIVLIEYENLYYFLQVISPSVSYPSILTSPWSDIFIIDIYQGFTVAIQLSNQSSYYPVTGFI